MQSVYMNAHMGTCASAHVHTDRSPRKTSNVFLYHSPPQYSTESLTYRGTHCLARLAGLQAQASSCACLLLYLPPMLGTQTSTAIPRGFVGSRNLNLGPHYLTVRSLPGEPSRKFNYFVSKMLLILVSINQLVS